jgi:RNA exonuclease 4
VSLFKEYRLEGKRTKLQTLAKQYIGIDIQGGVHSSVEDSQAALALYILRKQAIDSALKFLPADFSN